MTLVKIETPELKVIEESKALQIKKTFEPMVTMLETFEESYNAIIKESKKEITLELCMRSKRLRLDVGRVRIDTGKLKDKQKEKIKLEDKAIMGVHNILVWAVTEKEDTLKGIENHFENLEKERIEKLQEERATEVMKYEGQMVVPTLGIMDDEVWKNYINGVKLNHDQKIAAEKQVELDRIETERLQKLHESRKELLIPYWSFIPSGNEYDDFSKLNDDEWKERFEWTKNEKIEYDKKQEEIRKENLRLEKEAKELRERTSKRNDELRPYIVFIREYNKLLAKDEKAYQDELKEIKIGAELQWGYDRKEMIKKGKEENKKEQDRINLEHRLKIKEDAEQKEKQRLLDIELTKEKAKKDAALAPDKDKLIALSNRIINIELPQLSSKESIKILDEVTQLLFKVDNYIKEKVESL